ncbi:T9SS type A sorting domain-containing protein [Haliscomenobacter hydrossis]|uniref:T9SS type A sorting domain-containing protein n=1 Tax=Haliscomenobacter hydrossis TaxID=2350 RepID=UPI0005C54BFA
MYIKLEPHPYQLLPNPFSEEILLHIDENSVLIKGMFQLYNVQGQLVYRKTLTSSSSIRIEPGLLPAGIYFYSIKDYQGNIRGSGKLLRK